MEKQAQLKKQVEYYLSDNNLKGDKFFHRELLKQADGFMDINLIMKCRNVKNLNVDMAFLL